MAITETESPPSPSDDVRLLRHAFGPRRQHHLGLPQPDQLRRRDDGLEPGAAEPVDGHRRNADRAAGLESNVARQVRVRSRGLNRVSHDHLVHLIGSDAAPLERPSGRVRAKLDRADVS